MGTGRGGGKVSKSTNPSGTKDTTDALKGKLGNKVMKAYNGKSKEADEYRDINVKYLRDANPHRNDYMSKSGKERDKLYEMWRENCQRAAMVTDLRLAGYDIEAMHNPGDQAGWFSDYNDISYKNFFVGAQWVKSGASDASGAVKELDSLLPDVGARAIIRIRWNDGKGNDIGGHVWNIVRTQYGLRGIDGQTGTVFDPNKYLKDGMYDGSMHFLVTNKGGSTADIYTDIDPKMAPLYFKGRSKK